MRQCDGVGARTWQRDNGSEGFQKSPNVNSLCPLLGLRSFIFGIILIFDGNVICQKNPLVTFIFSTETKSIGKIRR